MAIRAWGDALPNSEAPRLPNLEPDQFWFILRVSGMEQPLLTWLSSMNDPESENYDPVNWAQISAKLDFAKFFERDNPLIEAARTELNISSEELDALWMYGTNG